MSADFDVPGFEPEEPADIWSRSEEPFETYADEIDARISEEAARAATCFAHRCQGRPITNKRGELSGSFACHAHLRDLESLEITLAEMTPCSTLIDEPIGDPEFMWGGVPNEYGVLSGVFQKGDICAFGGYSGVGKTTVVFSLVSLWASNEGGSFIGLPVPGRKRILFITEAGKRQVKKALVRSGLKNEEVERVAVIRNPKLTGVALREMVQRHRADVVVLDSITSVAPVLTIHGRESFNWNQPEHITAVVSYLRGLQSDFNLDLILYMAHTKKVGREAKRERPVLEDFRGTGALVEQAEWAGIILPHESEKSPGWLASLKSRDKEEWIENLYFSFDIRNFEYEACEPPAPKSSQLSAEERKASEASRKVAELEAPIRVVLFRNSNEPMSTNGLISAVKNLESSRTGGKASPGNPAVFKSVLEALAGDGPLVHRPGPRGGDLWLLNKQAFESTVVFAASKGWDAEDFDSLDPMRDGSAVGESGR